MIEVRPTGAALGADILGADLSRPPAPAEFGAIHRAWMTHVVLRFRGQTLTDEQLMAFSRNFGALDGNPRHAKVEGRAASAAAGFVNVISNVVTGSSHVRGALTMSSPAASWSARKILSKHPASAWRAKSI